MEMDSENAGAIENTSYIKFVIRRHVHKKEPKNATDVKKDLKSDESVRALYNGWCLYHKIERSPEEMQKRFNIFKASAFRVREVNKSGLAALCLNRFADREINHDVIVVDV